MKITCKFKMTFLKSYFNVKQTHTRIERESTNTNSDTNSDQSLSVTNKNLPGDKHHSAKRRERNVRGKQYLNHKIDGDNGLTTQQKTQEVNYRSDRKGYNDRRVNDSDGFAPKVSSNEKNHNRERCKERDRTNVSFESHVNETPDTKNNPTFHSSDGTHLGGRSVIKQNRQHKLSGDFGESGGCRGKHPTGNASQHIKRDSECFPGMNKSFQVHIANVPTTRKDKGPQVNSVPPAISKDIPTSGKDSSESSEDSTSSACNLVRRNAIRPSDSNSSFPSLIHVSKTKPSPYPYRKPSCVNLPFDVDKKGKPPIDRTKTGTNGKKAVELPFSKSTEMVFFVDDAKSTAPAFLRMATASENRKSSDSQSKAVDMEEHKSSIYPFLPTSPLDCTLPFQVTCKAMSSPHYLLSNDAQPSTCDNATQGSLGDDVIVLPYSKSTKLVFFASPTQEAPTFLTLATTAMDENPTNTNEPDMLLEVPEKDKDLKYPYLPTSPLGCQLPFKLNGNLVSDNRLSFLLDENNNDKQPLNGGIDLEGPSDDVIEVPYSKSTKLVFFVDGNISETPAFLTMVAASESENLNDSYNEVEPLDDTKSEKYAKYPYLPTSPLGCMLPFQVMGRPSTSNKTQKKK